MNVTRDDSLGFALEPGCHSYRITDAADRFRGAVVASSSSRGREWWAFRIHPSRTRRWIPVATAATRKRAAELLIGGRP